VALVEVLSPARVLDVACGTGFLTRHLRGDVTALDQSERMLAIARERLPHARLVRDDAVPLPFADGAFERVFTSHFYGHLLEREREAFVAEARRVAAELLIVDSARRPDVPAECWEPRQLDDGSRHRVYKRWFTGAELAAELGGGDVLHDGRWFVVVRA
jgi:ubiquinone/menaquinone biosynthesis C-methylase UbiE